jgi:2-succinyl-6-hydroxy-2,4-cyclohexadiene-1-carboxylate synthase
MRNTITLLHGFMGDPSDWDEVRSTLTDYDIVTPSIRPAPDWDAGILALRQELPRHSILVGYSMGARLLLSLGMIQPDLVKGMVFVSGNPGIEAHDRQVLHQIDAQLAQRIEREPRHEFLSWWYRKGPFQSLTTSQVNDEIERKLGYRGDNWGEILRTYSISKQPNLWEAVIDAKFPMLAVAGELDAKYAKIVTNLGKLAHVEARIVPRCGHIVHHEQPQVFVQLLREFVEKLDNKLGTVARH